MKAKAAAKKRARKARLAAKKAGKSAAEQQAAEAEVFAEAERKAAEDAKNAEESSELSGSFSSTPEPSSDYEPFHGWPEVRPPAAVGSETLVVRGALQLSVSRSHPTRFGYARERGSLPTISKGERQT